MNISRETKLCATLFLTLAFVILPFKANADTASELQAKIAALLQQIQGLQLQLKNLQTPGLSDSGSGQVSGTGQVGGAGHCRRVEENLGLGSGGSSTSDLQERLISQGYLTLPQGVARGYFGTRTQSALLAWQRDNGISATGYFGPMSRSRFNASEVCGATPSTPSSQDPYPTPSSTNPLPPTQSYPTPSSASSIPLPASGDFRISPASVSVQIGGSTMVEALYAPYVTNCSNCGAAPTRKVTASWSSNNPAIATVNSIQPQCVTTPCDREVIVEGKTPGTATLTATYVDASGATLTASASVTVQ